MCRFQKMLNLKFGLLSYLSFFFLIVFFQNFCNAQQLPQIGFYEENLFILNPGVTGIEEETLIATAAFRRQWTGINQSPYSAMLSAHSPFENAKIAAGAYLLHDKTGPTGYSELGLSLSYQIFLGKYDRRKIYIGKSNRLTYKKLSFGFSANLAQYRLLGSDVVNRNLSDPAVLQTDASKIFPSASFGIFYRAPSFYVGFSVPQLLNLKIEFTEPGAIASITREQHYYFILGGKIYFMDEQMAFEPSLLLKFASASPLQADLVFRFRSFNIGWLGFGYRSKNALRFEAGFSISKMVHFGYVYDLPLANYSSILGQSHEAVVHLKFRQGR